MIHRQSNIVKSKKKSDTKSNKYVITTTLQLVIADDDTDDDSEPPFCLFVISLRRGTLASWEIYQFDKWAKKSHLTLTNDIIKGTNTCERIRACELNSAVLHLPTL